MPLEQVIGANLARALSGDGGRRLVRLPHHALLRSRAAVVEEPEDLLATIEEQVFQRRFGEVVRLEVQDGMPPHLRTLLLDELRDDRLPRDAR